MCVCVFIDAWSKASPNHKTNFMFEDTGIRQMQRSRKKKGFTDNYFSERDKRMRERERILGRKFIFWDFL